VRQMCAKLPETPQNDRLSHECDGGGQIGGGEFFLSPPLLEAVLSFRAVAA